MISEYKVKLKTNLLKSKQTKKKLTMWSKFSIRYFIFLLIFCYGGKYLSDVKEDFNQLSLSNMQVQDDTMIIPSRGLILSLVQLFPYTLIWQVTLYSLNQVYK